MRRLRAVRHSLPGAGAGDCVNQDDDAPPLIRLAQAEDAGCIAALCEQLGYPATTDSVRERLAGIGQDEHHAVFVAEAPGGVVGWIHVYLCPLVVVGWQAEIGGLVVDEGWRSRGVGRLLLERADGSRGFSQCRR